MSASDVQGLALVKAPRPDSSSACTCGHVQDIIDRRNRGWDPDTESNSERRELQMTRSQSSGASQRDTWLIAHLPEQGSPLAACFSQLDAVLPGPAGQAVLNGCFLLGGVHVALWCPMGPAEAVAQQLSCRHAMAGLLMLVIHLGSSSGPQW